MAAESDPSPKHGQTESKSERAPTVPAEGRKLATVARIESIRKHKNSVVEHLEVAEIRGWRSVVQKNLFQPGDLCVFCEIDSVLPMKPEYSFLAQRKYRVSSTRIKGELSQGICLFLPGPKETFTEGQDLTEALGIEKYDSYRDPQPKPKPFPDYVPKTDEERVQNLKPRTLEQLEGRQVYVTEKVDGSSATYIWNDGEFLVCSRNTIVDKSTASRTSQCFLDFAEKVGMEEKLQGMPKANLAIQGELIGPKIQGNYYETMDLRFYVFSIYLLDEEEPRYATYYELETICQLLGLRTVPLVFLGEVNFSLRRADILSMADGHSRIQPTKLREGVVIRTVTGKPRMSFKAVSNQWLMKK